MAEEIRKIQRTGGSTFTVSLPKEWVSEMKLKPGDPLYIRTLDNASLVITPGPPRHEGDAGEAVIRISSKDDPHTIARRLISLYLIGYSVVRIVSGDGRITPAQRNVVKGCAKGKLVGVEIITDQPDEMVLKVLVRHPDLSVRDALRRMAMISSSMLRDAIAAVRALDRRLAAEVMAMDDEVDRFSMYVIRQLKAAVDDRRLIGEVGLRRPRDCLGYRLIVKSVERIGDHAAAIAENLGVISRPVDPELMRGMEQMGDFAMRTFNAAIGSLFNEDGGSAEDVILGAEKIGDVERRLVALMSTSARGAEHAALRLMLESLRRVVEYSCDIAEVVLNLTSEGLIAKREV